MSPKIESIVSAYKTLAKIPSIVSGKLNNNATKVNSKWSVRNLDKGKTTKYSYCYVLDQSFNVVTDSEFGSDISNELLSAVSPKETYKAVIREVETKKPFLEVWQANHLAHSIDLAALDLHGEVYSGATFGSLSWSPDESSVVYIAERKLPKSEPFIKRKTVKDETKSTNANEETPPKKGEEYTYKQDWGEQLTGKHLSVIVFCELKTETFTVLEGLPESWCPGQVCFAPDGKSILGVAWLTQPRRLGLIFCTNRPSYIFRLTLDGILTKLSSDGLAVRSPRVSPSGDVLWLQRTSGGPHHACHQLVISTLTGEVRTVIDVVAKEKPTANGGTFHGVYCTALPQKCFSNDGGRCVFSTPQKTAVKSYVVDLEDGRLAELKNPDMSGSLTILDVKNDVVLASCSNVSTPAQLFVARLPAKGSEQEMVWKRVSRPIEVPTSVSAGTIRIMDLQHEDSKDPIKTFSAIYFEPKAEGDQKYPMVVWPHGGPHSSFVDVYSLETAFFAMLGMACVRVNFRGSTGQGEDSVRCLLGNVGSYDIADCLLAVDTLIETETGRIDRNKLCLFGGSYGGFVVGHILAKASHLFNSAVMRNPLLDLATKAEYADNSDGCAVEAGFEFTEQGPVSEEQLVAMRRCSPIAHVHRMVAPTALMLGSGDKRVPYYQGLQYHRRLLANGVKTKLFLYEDNHSLSSQPAEMDNLINSANWFLEHLPA